MQFENGDRYVVRRLVSVYRDGGFYYLPYFVRSFIDEDTVTKRLSRGDGRLIKGFTTYRKALK